MFDLSNNALWCLLLAEMEEVKANSAYEDLRKARMLENQVLSSSPYSSLWHSTASRLINLFFILSCGLSDAQQARLESLGLQKTISELRSITSSKPKVQKRKCIKVDYSSSPLRRSNRLQGKSCDYKPLVEVEDEFTQLTPSMTAKNGFAYQPSPDALSRRCSSKARGSVYDPVYGICCHFCRFCAKCFCFIF